METKKKSLIILYAVIFIIGVAIPMIGLLFPETFFSNQERIQAALESYGALAPLLFILLSIVPVVVTPLNHSVFGIIGGFIFGTWQGFILNWIAKVLGTLITFYIGRKLGRKAVLRFIDAETMEKYDKLFNRSKIAWFLIYSIPFLGPDELPYLAGLSSIGLQTFLPLAMLAHVNKSLFLAFLGSGISFEDPAFVIVLVSTFLLGVLFLIYSRRYGHKDR